MNRIKNMNKLVIKILFMLVILMLSTTFTYKVNALYMDYTVLSTSTNPYWYCSEHGARLSAGNFNMYASGGTPKDTEDEGTALNEGTANAVNGLSNGNNTVSKETYDALGGLEYSTSKLSPYEKVGESYANPIETYILLFGDGYYGYKANGSPYQEMWWEQPAGKGQVHEAGGAVHGVNIENEELVYYANNSDIFNSDNRATKSTTLLAGLKGVEENKDTYVEVAGRMVNFAANNNANDSSSNNEGVIHTNSSSARAEASTFLEYFRKMTGQKDPICGKDGYDINYEFKWLTGLVNSDNDDLSYDEPTVFKRDNKFEVGPFGIDYVHAYTSDKVFSEITKMEIVLGTDNSSDITLVLDKDNNQFTINKEGNGSYKFPEPNKPFYLVFDSIEHVTKIKNIKVYFTYMNARGKYELWDGDYTDSKYKVQQYTTTGKDGETVYGLKVTTTTKKSIAQTVSTESTDEKTEYWYKNIDIKRDVNIQSGKVVVKKVLVDSEGREIDYDALTNEEKVFNFKLDVTGAITDDMGAAEDTATINDVIAGVKAGGEYVSSKVFYWMNNANSTEVNNAPTFVLRETTHPELLKEIKEVNTSGHGVYENGEFRGILEDDKSIELVVTNKIETSKGNITIKKIDKPVTLNGHTYKIDENAVFNIKVKLTAPEGGIFRVKNETGYDYFRESDEPYTTSVDLKVGQEAFIEGIEWYGDKAPKYEIEENLENRTDARLVNITPKTGELVNIVNGEDSRPITVTVENEAVTHKAYIHIIKSVVIDDVDEETRQALIDKIKDEVYAFDINVDGFDTESTGDITSKFDGTKYIWEYTSQEYNWQGDTAPEYTITETKAPEGTKFVKDGTELVDKTTPKEKLVENAENDYKVDNVVENHINVKHTSRISLEKIIDSKKLEGKDFIFELKLTGIFKYGGKLYIATEENPVWLVNSDVNAQKLNAVDAKDYIKLRIDNIEDGHETETSVPVSTGDEYIEWYSCSGAPKFEVYENTEGLGDVLKSTEITPASGELVKYKTIDDSGKEKVVVDDEAIIEIKAKNNGIITKEGRLHVIKTLEGASNYKPEDIRDIKFYFEVSYSDDNYTHKEPLTLNAEYNENNNTWVWEGYTATKTWKETEEAPKYRIEEIISEELKEKGIEFVSIESACGNPDTSRDGNALTGTLVEFETKETDADEYLYGNDIEVINRIEQEYTGRIVLTKIIEDKDNLKKYGKENGYHFVIKVSSNSEFYYEMNGKKEKIDAGTIINITNKEDNFKGYSDRDNDTVEIKVDDSLISTWTSGTFSWKDPKNAPRVEEIKEVEAESVPTDLAGLKCTITPKSGTINGDFKVTAKNTITEPDKGTIQIVKHLDNREGKFNDDKIMSMVFKFKVLVDGYKSTEVTLKPQGSNFGAEIIEFKSDILTYSWRGEAPYATVEEFEIDKSAEFVSVTTNSTDAEINGKRVRIQLKKNNNFEFIYTDKTKNNDTEGYLKIKKNINSDSLKNEDFIFDVKVTGSFTYGGKKYSNETLTLDPITVKGGSESDIIGPFIWENEANAPTYVVTERDHDKAKLVSITNGSGSLKPNTTVTVIATNEAKKTGGYLEITKQITGGKITDKSFTFEIKIGNYAPYRVTIKANETYKTDKYEWDASESAPEYTVTEIVTEGTTLESISEVGKQVDEAEKERNKNAKSISGTLKPDDAIVEVVATNSLKKNEGDFKVYKEVLADKKTVKDADKLKFEIKVSVYGDFEYYDESKGSFVKPNTNPLVLENIKINADNSYTSPKFQWYGDNAPTIVVEEKLSGNEYKGWQNTGISNNNVDLQDKMTIPVVVTNEYRIIKKLDLTVELGGDVWEDIPENKRMKNYEGISEPNGRIDSEESGIKGVEVYIYDTVTGELATVYSDSMDTKLTQPIITSPNGHWQAPRVNMSGESDRFEIRFKYDGQTYEPTKQILAIDKTKGLSDEAKIDLFMKETSSNRNLYSKTSMAKDIDRNEVNNRIQSVYGYSAITGDGDTLGKVNGTTGERTINYKSIPGSNDEVIRKSKLQTTDSNGVAYDLFKATASTGTKLVFPCDNSMRLYNKSVNLTDYGREETYYYSATYDYTKHINLGLTRREETDIEVVKDLVQANVVLKDNVATYKFNRLSDVGKEVYTLTYELGLYKTDYYYRAEMYQTGLTQAEYNALSSLDLASSELEVYLQYRITLRNSGSSLYKARINKVDDYYDSTFIPVLNTVTVNNTVVAEAPRITKGTMTINNASGIIKGSDGVNYRKATIDLNNVELASGEKAEIYLACHISKGNFAGVQRAIALGGKSNIAEVSNYTTLFAEGNAIAGKIDCNSAPGNINIVEHNVKSYYEDDTYAAPVLDLKLSESGRTVSGVAWEDKADFSAVGNGLRDEDEAVIGGLTTELVEKLNVNVNGVNKDIDFVWPTNTKLDSLGGKTIEELAGFSSTIETSRGTETEQAGTYAFNSTPTGNYAVRFTYGNNKMNLRNTSRVSSAPVGYVDAGSSLASGNVNILSSNYENDVLVKAAAVYNGQDYKSTIYQKGVTSAENGYFTDEWFNLQNPDLVNANNVSDARDNEVRRLEVIAKSETITNSNAKVLNSANDKSSLHTDLYNDYYMYADTAKMNLSIENLKNSAVQGVAKNNGAEISPVSGNEVIRTYNLNNIDFGLIERPKTSIILDKEISEITLRTNDEKVIFNAKYNVSYSLEDNDNFDRVLVQIRRRENENGSLKDITKYLVANISLDESSIGTEVLQALDKKERKLVNEITSGVQNFRFINVDEEILQGTTIEIGYKLNVLNVGDVDYTSNILANITSLREEDKLARIADAINNINGANEYKVGEYLGSYYYTGEVSESDAVVKTKVRQLVDYIDNDGEFEPEFNGNKDHSWKTTSSMELQGYGYNDERILDFEVTAINELYDDHNKAYISDDNKNLVLSVDDIGNDTDTLNNNGLEADLVPINLNGNNEGDNRFNSEIDLTVTKVVSAQEDADNLAYDNIAEIVKFENSVGRRDITSIPGNSNPKKTGEFSEGLSERDSSATEIVTFTPPQGIEEQSVLTNQVLIAVVMALGIAAVGIVVIKKKVLTK